ncbi:hypothetical protein ACIQF5_21965 [Streptomyces goshikiensis]|uniref:hypothetical protein n=1 Tax=Streptomyces goshikiensis TaxID=1942 RepID=UPI00381A932A
MVVYEPERLRPCCSLGAVLQGAFARARGRCEAGKGSEEAVEPGLTAATMLVALVNLCEHRIEVHGEDPGPVADCSDCLRFEVPAAAAPEGGLRLSGAEWAYERNIHHVAHAVAPQVVAVPKALGAGPCQ